MQTEQIETALKLITDEGARFSGGWDDGGAGVMERDLKAFTDGVKFALSGGRVTDLYMQILDKRAKEQDPEYQAYLELQKKMESKYGKQV